MFDPVGSDMIPAPSSPTISSVSSSDLDTESTGSFFHDRSTSLGTLMGVNFPTITFRTPQSQARVASSSTSAVGGGGGRKKQRKKRLVALSAEKPRRRWWSICRDDDDAKPGSLGEFLEVERRFGDGDFYGEAAEMEGRLVEENGRRVLFADGRVLPPAAAQVEESPSTAAVLCRFPISGICSGQRLMNMFG